MPTYYIVRYYAERRADEGCHFFPAQIIQRGLTLEEARAHCAHETSQGRDAAGRLIWFENRTSGKFSNK